MNISCVDLGPHRHPPAPAALLAPGELLEVLRELPGRIWGDGSKSSCGRSVLCSRGICQLLPKPPSCVYFGAEEEGRREGGIIILLVAIESGEGRVCGAHEPPDLHARLPEKPSPVSPVGFVFITRQTFNYFTFMLLLNRLRELQKIMHFYFYILY